MKPQCIGGYVIRIEKVNSTNSFMSELMMQKKLDEGTVVTSFFQMEGKGQRGTQWESEPGKNITLSVLLKPNFLETEKQFLLSKSVALAVRDFVKSFFNSNTNQPVHVKWPNDVYIANSKVAGILIENTIVSGKITHSVIGIGVNINQEHFFGKLITATSIKKCTDIEYDLEDCRTQLYLFLEQRYSQLKFNRNSIDADYLNSLLFFGEWKGYLFKGENIKAKVIGVDSLGRLLLEKENGELLQGDIKEVQLIL